MAISISYNLRNVTQRPLSTLATTPGIVLVVAILVGAFALASGFQAAMVGGHDAVAAFGLARLLTRTRAEAATGSRDVDFATTLFRQIKLTCRQVLSLLHLPLDCALSSA